MCLVHPLLETSLFFDTFRLSILFFLFFSVVRSAFSISSCRMVLSWCSILFARRKFVRTFYLDQRIESGSSSSLSLFLFWLILNLFSICYVKDGFYSCLVYFVASSFSSFFFSSFSKEITSVFL